LPHPIDTPHFSAICFRFARLMLASRQAFLRLPFRQLSFFRFADFSLSFSISIAEIFSMSQPPYTIRHATADIS
jgi:hypothetical protein